MGSSKVKVVSLNSIIEKDVVEYDVDFHKSKVDWFEEHKGEELTWDLIEDYYNDNNMEEEERQIWKEVGNIEDTEIDASSEINRTIKDMLLLELDKGGQVIDKDMVAAVRSYVIGDDEVLDLDLPRDLDKRAELHEREDKNIDLF